MPAVLPEPNSREDEEASLRMKNTTAFKLIASRRQALSAQPRRATPAFYLRLCHHLAPQPHPSGFFPGTSGTPQEGLRCSPACRSLFRAWSRS